MTRPDRLARSTTDLLRIVEDLDRRGVGLIMLSMGGQTIDTRSPTGKLMITMLGAIAEFERGLLLERQREGVTKAKAEGKYKGRKLTARAKAAEVIKLEAEGLQRTEIARLTGIGIASVYRVLADFKKTAGDRMIVAAEEARGVLTRSSIARRCRETQRRTNVTQAIRLRVNRDHANPVEDFAVF